MASLGLQPAEFESCNSKNCTPETVARYTVPTRSYAAVSSQSLWCLKLLLRALTALARDIQLRLPSWLPMLTQPGRTLCGRAKISSLRVPGDRRSNSGYISSGLRLVSRTSAITTSQSTCLASSNTGSNRQRSNESPTAYSTIV